MPEVYKVGDMVWYIADRFELSVRAIKEIVYQKDEAFNVTSEVLLYRLSNHSLQGEWRSSDNGYADYNIFPFPEGRGIVVEKMRQKARWIRDDVESMQHSDPKVDTLDAYWMDDEICQAVYGKSAEEIRNEKEE